MRRLLLALATVVALAASQTAAVAHPFPDRIPLPDGFFPEGIASAGPTAWVGSLADGAIVQQDLRTGTTTSFAPSPGPDRIAVGLDVDQFGRLWVAGGGPGLLPGLVASVRAYDTATGALVYERAVAAGFVNDVVTTEDAAWFTDSFGAQLVRVPFGPGGSLGEPQAVALGGDYAPGPGFGLNGIAATGNALVVAQSAAPEGVGAALYRVPADADATSLAATRIVLDDVLPAADGLVLVGRTLHVVAGAPGVVEVRLSGDLTTGSVRGTTPVPDSVTPTTAARSGNRLLVVDAKFPTFGAPTETYETIAIER